MSTSLVLRDRRTKPARSDAISPREEKIVKQAIDLLERKVYARGPYLASPAVARDYLRLLLMREPNELFGVAFLTTQRQVIDCEVLFRGSVDQVSVYPRVVVQRALFHNCASIIVAHQHPSGCRVPSASDRTITMTLKSALALVDITLYDHLVFGIGEPFSFSENGWL